jgi:hypothetical protein
MRRRLLACTLLALTFGSAMTTVQAQPKRGGACFAAQDWGSWRASPDSRSIYLRVGVSQVFRLDLSTACPELQWPNAHLITQIRGGDWICGPLDLDLRVADGRDTAVPCIVSGMTSLSREEAAALPKNLRP